MTEPGSAPALAMRPLDRIAALIPVAPPDVRPGREGIAAAVDAIARTFRPAQIVLFGSRAYGMPTRESDVNLMIVMDDPPDRERIRLAIPPPELARSARFQVHVRRPEQIALGLAEGDFFIEDVMLKGITLYAGSDTDERALAPGDFAASNGASGEPGLKAATREWVRMADDEVRVVQIALGASPLLLDPACFHAQQCVEKYLKALLQERAIRFPRRSALPDLGSLVGSLAPGVAALDPDLRWLTDFAVEVSYPGLTASAADARRALNIAGQVRTLVRAALGLPTT